MFVTYGVIYVIGKHSKHLQL